MAHGRRSIFRSGLFWLSILSLLLTILFIFFGEYLKVSAFDNILKRIIYGSSFFFMVIIGELLYLFLTKEEEREKRRIAREERAKERRLVKKQKKQKKRAISSLRKKFYEAIKTVKKSNIYQKRATYNYELPWYLVLGGEDGEQKRVLDNSGLDFPINIEYREDEQNKEKGFEWYFSEEGVFVTIPKKYVTLDKNNSSHPVWLEFLRLFKKERWRRPINGIICIVDAEDINSDQKAKETQEYSKLLREKLNEISSSFHSKIPTYMIVTGVNNVSAFYKFFKNLTLEEKREILGVTFKDTDINVSQELIESKLADLLYSLENDTLVNIHNSWDRNERKELLFFLDEFRDFAAKTALFAQKTFSKTRYYKPLMLRGVYFSDISHATSTKYALTHSGAQVQAGYFMPKVFERIILSEPQLVEVNDDYRRKFGFFWALLFALIVLVISATIYYWAIHLKSEQSETRVIEDTFKEYQKLKKTDDPKLTLRRKAKKIDTSNAIQIGKLGGENGPNVSFAKGESVLTPFAIRRLKKVIEDIGKLDESTKIKIVGHTDSFGDEESNLILSRDRAESVKNFFVKSGIDSDRIATEGAGESTPIATNKTVEGRSLNRRVEIYAYGFAKQLNKPTYTEEYIIEDHLSDMQRILAMLDALKSMIRDSEKDIIDEPWKPGFMRISKRDKMVQSLYVKALQALLLPRVETIIEKYILDELDDRLSTQNNLKAYLMLSDKKHREVEFLKSYMLNRWGNDLSDAETMRFNKHFEELVESDFVSKKLTQKTILKARKKLISFAGSAGLVYKNLQEYARQHLHKDFQFAETLDAHPDMFEGATYRIPGFYTKDGYEKIILLKAKPFIKETIAKSWILGEDSDSSKTEVKRVFEKVLNLYFIDYRRHWSNALAKLKVPHYTSSAELTDQLELLSSGISPIVYILRALKENTYLYTPKERAEIAMKKKRESGITGAEIGGTIGSKIDRLTRLGAKNMGEFAGDKMIYDLRAIFKPYHELLDEKGKPSRKFQVVLRHVEKIYQQMLAVDTSADPKQSAFEIVSKKGSSSHKTFTLKSNLLPVSLLNWYNGALKSSWEYMTKMVDGHVEQAYSNEIWTFYNEKIKGRFPLNLHSSSDIDIADFKEFFKKGGMLDQFYEKYILPFVKIGSNGKYKLKPIDGKKVNIDRKMLESITHAKNIQRLFFQSGEEVRLKFRIKPRRLSASLSAMDLTYEEQELIYEHGPIQSVDFVWPAKYPDSLAKFTLYDTQSNRVVKSRGEGQWALLRLLFKTKHSILSKNRMIIYLKKGSFMGSFEVEGSGCKIFGTTNPLKHFKISKNN